MKEQILRIEIKVDGVTVEVREFSTARNNPVQAFQNFMHNTTKDMSSWCFAKLFD